MTLASIDPAPHRLDRRLRIGDRIVLDGQDDHPLGKDLVITGFFRRGADCFPACHGDDPDLEIVSTRSAYLRPRPIVEHRPANASALVADSRKVWVDQVLCGKIAIRCAQIWARFPPLTGHDRLRLTRWRAEVLG